MQHHSRDKESLSSQHKVLWILWGSLVFAPIALVGLMSHLSKTMEIEAPEIMTTILSIMAAFIIFQGLALGFFVLRNVGIRGIDRSAEPPLILTQALTSVRASYIVTWAIIEGGGTLIAMSVLFGGWHSWAVALLTLFLVAMALRAPTHERVTSELEYRLGKAGVASQDASAALLVWTET